MPPQGVDQRKWYKKKRYLIPLAIFAIAIASTATNSPKPEPYTSTVLTDTTTKAQYQTKPAFGWQETQKQPALSNNNYYTNVNGNRVHSPAYAESRPTNASAMCGDGTYSFSQNHRGTCSHHGGVSEWLY